jgi:succinate-semialdehyde dehydrogenase / glutarate-semialdehyde dehydrogenase
MLDHIAQIPQLQIADGALVKSEGLIAGKWTAARSRNTFDVTNPADGSVIATVPDMGRSDVEAAITAACQAAPGWQAKTAKERSALLKRWFGLINDNLEDLSRILTAEQGKPLQESRGEVAFGAAFIEWYAEEGKRIYGEVLPTYAADRRVLVLKQPIGVVGAITPWNFPSAMVTRKCAPALAAGCTIVLKPSEDTPLSALALAELAVRAGIPEGVVNVVTASRAKAQEIGQFLTSDPRVRKISFTGSTATGKILYRQCAEGVKKVSLELGGNAPLIVFDDADLEQSVKATIGSKFRNMGQTCVCANRVLVQSGIYEAFIERLGAEVRKMEVGPGWTGAMQGPLINTKAMKKVEEHVADALTRGGKIVCGGKRHRLGGNYFEPTVIRDVPIGALATREETFGPVAAIHRFEAEEEAVGKANDTPYGLAAYVFTENIARVWRVMEALDFGVVGVNEAVVSSESVPIGGFKESGIGREGAHHGIEGFIETKQVTIGNLGGALGGR